MCCLRQGAAVDMALFIQQNKYFVLTNRHKTAILGATFA